jgi:hypothetical protein
MDTSSHTEAFPLRNRKIALWAILIAFTVLMAVAAILMFFFFRAGSGSQIMRKNNVDDLRGALTILLDSYVSLIGIATAAFGVVAFLLTFQRAQWSVITTRAWRILIVGVYFLTLALLLAFVGREEILIMLIRNAVTLTLPTLSIARWLFYCCILIAAILISFFALEVAASSTLQSASDRPKTEGVNLPSPKCSGEGQPPTGLPS